VVYRVAAAMSERLNLGMRSLVDIEVVLVLCTMGADMLVRRFAGEIVH